MNPENEAQQLQRQNRALGILNAIAEALNRSVDLSQALHTTLAQVAELLDLHTGWVWLLHEETGESYLAASQNLPAALANHPGHMQGSCYCLDTFRAGDLDGAANVNVVTCSRLKKLVDGTDGLRYHASIPLYVHEKRLGVLNVASPDWRELSPDDLRLLYTVGDMLSIAIERARLFDYSTEYGAVQERNRLAREIHDTLAQGLAAITLQLETAEALLETDANPDQAKSAVHQALMMARNNLDEARRSVLDLRAAPLEGMTLPEALENLVAGANREEGSRVDLQVTGDRPLPVRIEAGLFRIAQEALANAVRHADAQNVWVKLTVFPDRIHLSIQDNGRGFDPTQIPPGRFGLVGLNERVKILGGRLHLKSSPGYGTHLEVNLPLPSFQGSGL